MHKKVALLQLCASNQNLIEERMHILEQYARLQPILAQWREENDTLKAILTSITIEKTYLLENNKNILALHNYLLFVNQ
eukprot:c43668_g1_i1 orf=924-1160(+)